MPFDPISYVLAKKKVGWSEVKSKLQTEGAVNVTYDTDLDGSIDTTKLEYPAESALYWGSGWNINRCYYMCNPNPTGEGIFAIAQLFPVVYIDKAVQGWGHFNCFMPMRVESPWLDESQNLLTNDDFYWGHMLVSIGEDRIVKRTGGTATILSNQVVTIDDTCDFALRSQVVGSTLKYWRDKYNVDLTTPTLTATDTDHASGYFGIGTCFGGEPANCFYEPHYNFRLEEPTSPGIPAKAIIETEVEEVEDPIEDKVLKPLLKQEIVLLHKLDVLDVPLTIKRKLRKIEVLEKRGFTEEEIEMLLDGIPRVDKYAVVWGLFDFKHDEHSTMVVTIFNNGQFSNKAIRVQMEHAKNVLKPPKDYGEAVEQYKQLRKEFDFVAGKDNWAYQTLGHEVFELLQVADTYYGNIIDGIKPDAYKKVPDDVMWRTLKEWVNRLEKTTVLTDERDKHINKLKTVLKKGW